MNTEDATAAMNAMFATSVQIADAQYVYQPERAGPYGGAEMSDEEEEEELEDDCGILGDQEEFNTLPNITHVPRADIFVPNVMDVLEGRQFPGDDEYVESEEEQLARLLQDSFRNKLMEVYSRNGATVPRFLQAALDQLFHGYTCPYAQRWPELWAKYQESLGQLYVNHVLKLKQEQLRHQA